MIARPWGWIRLIGWVGLLTLFHRPWRELGGVVSEQSRWLAWFVPGIGLLAGQWIGETLARTSTRLNRARRRRWALYPVAATAVTVLLFQALAGQATALSIAVLTTLSYAAGFDLAFDVWPAIRLRQPEDR